DLLRQKEKIDWIRLGDSSSAYFYANLKRKYKQAYISKMIDRDGKILIDNDQIEKEVYTFDKDLVGTSTTMLKKIYIEVMREGNQVSSENYQYLIWPVSENDIHQALKKMNDLTAPGVNGYGACFYKTTWTIVKTDIIFTIQDFFMNDRLYKAMNNIIMTIIPNFEGACKIKDFRPISCVTIMRKL
ncbi:unnamed protein product, partial [Vicia faba]